MSGDEAVVKGKPVSNGFNYFIFLQTRNVFTLLKIAMPTAQMSCENLSQFKDERLKCIYYLGKKFGHTYEKNLFFRLFNQKIITIAEVTLGVAFLFTMPPQHLQSNS